jgi:hypothetical protein
MKRQDLIKEVESKLNAFEEVYGERSYCFSFKGAANHAKRINRTNLYRAEKTGENHYTVTGL